MKARNVEVALSSALAVVSVGKSSRLERCCLQNLISGGDCSEGSRSDLVMCKPSCKAASSMAKDNRMPLVATLVALSGVQRPVKIAGIPGSISESAMSKQLIRAAIKIAATIPGLEVEYIDIDSLPVFNIDLVKDGKYPPVVETFMNQVRAADGILFASPEYNYTVSAQDGILVGSQYHLRQIGFRPDIYYINKPELFINVTPPVLDDNGNITNPYIEKEFRDLLVSLQKFTIRLRPCAEPTSRHHCYLIDLTSRL
ncbi:NADPH:quinone oxidoreductase [Sesamum alatum]|uniref:NAD(P)H dehydrogenase (quinone) n=1 Tax=Sesamum alatum TaxID=300844 RepID=A0AAE2CGL2_9LAMI|nr:NADPH:quinone oxidoreductase [Sesamum alatum]